MHATGMFEVKKWDEVPYNEGEGLPKMTRASVTSTYHGNIEAEGTLEYLMMYRNDGTASFIGLERVVGSIGHRLGSFVLQHSGTFEGDKAKSTSVVVPGSGTGELRGIQGNGGFVAPHGQIVPYTLDYDFE